MALVVHFVPDPAKSNRRDVAGLAAQQHGCGLCMGLYERWITHSAYFGGDEGDRSRTTHPAEPAGNLLGGPRRTWRQAGFVQIGTRAISISVEFESFDELWQSMTMPVGPAGKAIAGLSPSTRERLRSVLERQLPLTDGGGIAYEARANAIKGHKAA